MFDVYVALPSENAEGWEYHYVCAVPKATDMAEVVTALDVLFPQRLGCSIEPMKDFDDASK